MNTEYRTRTGAPLPEFFEDWELPKAVPCCPECEEELTDEELAAETLDYECLPLCSKCSGYGWDDEEYDEMLDDVEGFDVDADDEVNAKLIMQMRQKRKPNVSA